MTSRLAELEQENAALKAALNELKAAAAPFAGTYFRYRAEDWPDHLDRRVYRRLAILATETSDFIVLDPDRAAPARKSATQKRRTRA